MFFSQTSPTLSAGNSNINGLGLFGSTGFNTGIQPIGFSTSSTSQNNFSTATANSGTLLSQTSISQAGTSNLSNLFGNSILPTSSTGINGSGVGSTSFGMPHLQNSSQLQNSTQAQYLPLNPTVGQLTNYIQSLKPEFDDIENQLRINDRHIEYLTNNKLVEIKRLCNTYKKGVERRKEEIENINSIQFRVQDSIESIISEITTVQQLSHEITHIYDRIKDTDVTNSRQMNPLRFPLPIFEFFCENMAKKCIDIEEMIGNLDRTVSSLREEMTSTTAEDVLKYIAEIINNNYEFFYELITQCSQLHDKTESIVNMSKLHEATRN
ncbi:nucleoporin Nup45 [Cryptosporidium felis]|nr:nucleoporin Nup45 [Cryptosporidium felis]